MKRVIAPLLTIVMAFSLFCPIVSANDSQLWYKHLATCKVGLDISKNGRANCFGSVISGEPSDTVDVMITLQKQNGNSWEHVRNWSASGTQYATVDKAYYVVPGTYRAYVSISVYDANGGFVEGTTLLSKTVTYK